VWIAGEHTKKLPASVLTPTVTKANELFAAGDRLISSEQLRRVVSLPRDLGSLDADTQRQVERFLNWARQQGADRSYTAKHRQAWWSVELRDPAPLLCTYMARRPPTFVRNGCDARHLNIAHGLYPRDDLDHGTLEALAAWLRSNVSTGAGRTYAGGLTKFEPKEIERIWIPQPDELFS
jgi:hypothetical protein